MSDVIDILERMGQDAKWSYASLEDIRLALTEADIDPVLQTAIVADDQNALANLLGLSPLCSMLEPGKQDEKEYEDNEEVPPDEEENTSGHSLSDTLVSGG